MNSDVMRALYDTVNGGPERAFECLLTIPGFPGNDYEHPDEIEAHWICGFVCRTLRGMRMHQKKVHRFRPQGIIFEAQDSLIEVSAMGASEEPYV